VRTLITILVFCLAAAVTGSIVQHASADQPSPTSGAAGRDASSFSVITKENLPALVDDAPVVPDDPLAEDKGRLVLVARDAAGMRTAVVAAVYERGTERELFSSHLADGVTYTDLPPGHYDIRFRYGGVIGVLRIDGVEVEAQRHVLMEAGGPDELGRLSIAATDALGEPMRMMASVFDVTMQTEFTRQLLAADGTATLDVQPGTYRVHFAHAVAITSEPVEVQAGEHATVTAGGYGRLVVNVGDDEEVFATVYRSDPLERMGTRQVNVEAYFDLPPGEYDVHLALEPAVQLRNISVVAGQANMVNAPADGSIRPKSNGKFMLVSILAIIGIIVVGWLLLKRGVVRPQT